MLPTPAQMAMNTSVCALDRPVRPTLGLVLAVVGGIDTCDR